MWRHLTRNLQQGFKRSLCLEKPDACGKDNRPKNNSYPNICWARRLLPSAYQNLNHCNLSQDDRNQYDKEQYDKANISQHTFLEAFGWSGAIVFGWVISKQLWLTHRWQDRDQHSSTNVYHDSFIELLTRVVKTQPPGSYVLPQIQSATTSQPLKDEEDSFEAAANEVQCLHEKAIGEALNRRGIACLSKSSNLEAIKYFQRASELKYAAASFNMGQCCELGIGTKQDFKQAAEWYKIASDQGHSTAMYNLGVFYAHGWGGLHSDIIVAKELFVKAAKLGQPDAKAALEKESSSRKFNEMNEMPNIGSEIHSIDIESPSIEIIIEKLRSDDVFQTRFTSKNKWDFPFNTTVAF